MFQLPCDTGFRGACEECRKDTRDDSMCRAMCTQTHRCQRSRPINNYNLYQGMCEEHGEDYQDLWDASPKNARELITFILNPATFPTHIWPMVITTFDMSLDNVIRTFLSPLGFWALESTHVTMLIYWGAEYVIGANVFHPLLFMKSDVTYSYVADYLGEMLPWLMSGRDSDQKWLRCVELFRDGFELGFIDECQVLSEPTCSWRDDWTLHLETWVEQHSETYGWSDDVTLMCARRVDELLDAIASILNRVREGQRMSMGSREEVLANVKAYVDSLER